MRLFPVSVTRIPPAPSEARSAGPLSVAAVAAPLSPVKPGWPESDPAIVLIFPPGTKLRRRWVAVSETTTEPARSMTPAGGVKQEAAAGGRPVGAPADPRAPARDRVGTAS